MRVDNIAPIYYLVLQTEKTHQKDRKGLRVSVSTMLSLCQQRSGRVWDSPLVLYLEIHTSGIIWLLNKVKANSICITGSKIYMSYHWSGSKSPQLPWLFPSWSQTSSWKILVQLWPWLQILVPWLVFSLQARQAITSRRGQLLKV